MASNQSSIPPFEDALETQANWTIVQESFFIDQMVDLVNARGDNRANGVSTKNEWTIIRKAYYQRFRLKHSKKAFKNKMNNFKERFKDFKRLVETNTGLGWDPILKTVDATPYWWENYLKSNPRMKRFRTQGCPEYEKLGIIFGDTIATGHIQASQDHGFDSSQEDDDRDDLNGSGTVTPSASRNATINNDEEEGEQSRPSKRSRTTTSSRRSKSKSSELSDAIRLFAETFQARNEIHKQYSIKECMEVLDNMEGVTENVYMRAVKLLQDKGWRETFMVMAPERRNNWVGSIDDGVL